MMPNKTKGNILTSLQGNRDDRYKVDTNGYNLLRMLHDLNTMADQERKETLKGSNFVPWAQSNLGIKGTQTDRVVSILRTSFWSRLLATYVQTSYGQKVFNFTTAGEISNTKLAFV